jgi:hypothetical protein
MTLSLLLLELSPRSDNSVNFVDIWYNTVGSLYDGVSLNLVPVGHKRDGILVVLNDHDKKSTQLAEWIEDTDGEFDNESLFVIWDNVSSKAKSRSGVHEYGPFGKDGIRQLVREYPLA